MFIIKFLTNYTKNKNNKNNMKLNSKDDRIMHKKIQI